MPTQTEEQQAAEFLKRAEIRTMKKDLRALREGDALKERDKIAKVKTLEEQMASAPVPKRQAPNSDQEMADLKKVLSENATQERLAEKDLKEYATEQERQQIFLIESERLGLEKQIDQIGKEKDPALKLEKNNLMIKKREQEEKLKSITDKEQKLENEEKMIEEKSQSTSISSEKKSLEQRRWELEAEIKEVEKRRWEAENQIAATDKKIEGIDGALAQLVQEKNNLQSKVLGADKSLRDIYSGVITRVEEKKLGQAKEQKARQEELSKSRTEQKENVQREQWTGSLAVPKKKEFLKTAPNSLKERLAKTAEAEEEQRKKFLQNVEENANKKT